VDEEDLLDLYGKAVACAVLGKISPHRTRVLLLLQKVPSASEDYILFYMQSL